MSYEPKMVVNPTNKTVEFRYDSKPYIFEPHEKRILEGAVADHALKRHGRIFKEFSEGDVIEVSDVNYAELPWKKLVSIGSKAGVFKPGMPREDLEEALYEQDGII